MIEKKPVFHNRKNESIIIDGKTYWISRSVACVSVILTNWNDEWYVLFTKRGTGAADFQGYWCLPCGYLDYSENLTDCVIRETYEETGLFILDIPQNQIIMDYTSQSYFIQSEPTSNKQNVSHYFGFVFDSKWSLPILTTENAEPNEVEIAKWVKLSELGGYSKVAFNHMERIHEFLRDFNIKGNGKFIL